jgi:hypothetical protein
MKKAENGEPALRRFQELTWALELAVNGRKHFYKTD